MKLGWQFDGTCSLPEHHDAEAGKRAGLARKACVSCPVASDCLEYALGNDVYGIWANTNRQQRKARV